MSAASNLLRFFLLSFGYVIIQMALTPVRLRLLTQILGEETYGLLTFVILTVNLLIFTLSLGMFEYLLRRLPGMQPLEQYRLYERLLRIYLILIVITSFVGTAVMLFFFVGERFTEENTLAAALALVTNAVLQFRIFFLLGRNQLLQFRLTQLLANDLWFFLVLAVWPFVDLSLTLVLWIWAGWLIFTMLATEVWGPFKLVFLKQVAPDPLRLILQFGIPLLPLILGELLIRYADKAFVTHFLGVAAMGEYTATMNVALLVYLVSTNVIGLLVPKFNGQRNDLSEGTEPSSDPDLRRSFSVMLRYGLILGGFGSAVIGCLGSFVLAILVAPDFRDAAYILPWAAPASFFFTLHLVFSRVLIALDRSKIVGGLTLVAAGLNTVLNPILIPKFGEQGMLGAALATTISLAVLCLATGIAVGLPRWISWSHLRLGRWCAAFALSLIMYGASAAYLAGWNAFLVLGLNGFGSVILLGIFGLVTPEDMKDLFSKSASEPT